MLERTRINKKQVIMAHPKAECRGPHCPIHSPSDHSMRFFPLYWRDDRGLMERTCAHGIGHPDPDDLQFKHDMLGKDYKRYAFGVHGCDGCCVHAYEHVDLE